MGIKPTKIKTLLGSCIAVCLYDKIRKIGAMNHYLTPLWRDHDLKTPKYGDISIERLINIMLASGSMISNLQAKVFGGAHMFESNKTHIMLGKQNILIAQTVLGNYGIKIVAQDIGGNRGRRINMNTYTGKVLMRYNKKE